MDMVLISKRYRETKSPTFVRGKDFHSFAAMLTRSNIAQKMIVISKAKVPIIKFVDALTGLRVDISFDNGSGLVANETFQAWKLQYPAMPVIVVLIKQLLAMRDLNDVSTKGLGGFSVTCLVVSMLQLMPQVQSGAMVPEQRLGDLLMEFLDLYGNKFDTRKSVISLDPPGYLEKVSLSTQRGVAVCKRLTFSTLAAQPNESALPRSELTSVSYHRPQSTGQRYLRWYRQDCDDPGSICTSVQRSA